MRRLEQRRADGCDGIGTPRPAWESNVGRPLVTGRCPRRARRVAGTTRSWSSRAGITSSLSAGTARRVCAGPRPRGAREFCTKSPRGENAAVLVGTSGTRPQRHVVELASRRWRSPRRRARVASMALGRRNRRLRRWPRRRLGRRSGRRLRRRLARRHRGGRRPVRKSTSESGAVVASMAWRP